MVIEGATDDVMAVTGAGASAKATTLRLVPPMPDVQPSRAWQRLLIASEPWPSLFDRYTSTGFLTASSRDIEPCVADAARLLAYGHLGTPLVVDLSEAAAVRDWLALPVRGNDSAGRRRAAVGRLPVAEISMHVFSLPEDTEAEADGLSLPPPPAQTLFVQCALSSSMQALVQLPHLDEVGVLLYDVRRVSLLESAFVPLVGLVISRHGNGIGPMASFYVEVDSEGRVPPMAVNVCRWFPPLPQATRASLGDVLGWCMAAALSGKPYVERSIDRTEGEACERRWGRQPTAMVTVAAAEAGLSLREARS